MAVISGASAAITIGGPRTGSPAGVAVPGLISYTVPDRTTFDITAAGDTRQRSKLGLLPAAITADCWLDMSEADIESAITSGTATSAYFYAGDELIETLDSCYITRNINTTGPNAAAKGSLTFHAA